MLHYLWPMDHIKNAWPIFYTWAKGEAWSEIPRPLRDQIGKAQRRFERGTLTLLGVASLVGRVQEVVGREVFALRLEIDRVG